MNDENNLHKNQLYAYIVFPCPYQNILPPLLTCHNYYILSQAHVKSVTISRIGPIPMLALYNCHLCTIDLIYRAICSFSPIQIIIVESNSLQFQNQVCWWHQSQLCSVNHFHHTYLNPFSTVITKRWTINLHMSFRVANSYQAPVAN